MNTSPPNKRRRSSSPSAPPRPSASPTRPILPPPTPSAHAQPGLYPTFAPAPTSAVAGPSWQSWSSERDREARRSMDARSPISDVDSRMEGIDEGSEGGMVFSRDNSGRAPRSMMACTRCRRQKMKCDGPGQLPCRGCRASGQPCIFEARSRPKSVSALPSSRQTFYPPPPSPLGRPGSPIPLPSPAGPSGSSGFYPSHSQPAPPVTSRTPMPPSDSFIMRSAREPLPPAPPTSLTALASSQYALRGHTPSASTSAIPSAPPHSMYYHPPPQPISHPPPISRPISPTEIRWRNVEGSLRTLQAVPSGVNSIQSTLTYIQRSADAIFSAVSRPPPVRSALKARESLPDISDSAWQSYRSSAWPLTPWLVGLREHSGLPGLVVLFLGKRTLVDRSDQSRRECEDAASEVYAEVGRIMAERLEWTREEIRALGVFATWTNDGTLACLAMGHARMQGLERILSPRKTHDDWREWIYLSLMDKLSHVFDFIQPISSDSLSLAWRDRLNASSAPDPAVRDRDLKLLAWLEYAENLAEVLRFQQSTRITALEEESVSPRGETGDRPTSGSAAAGNMVAKALEVGKKWGTRWEHWANAWSVRSDPILALHFNYATLFSTSPVFLCNQTVWTDLASNHEGFQHLERTRDAAFAVIQAICSPEVSRTLPFSFALFRPLLGLALQTLISLQTALPNSPIISLVHLTSVLRSTHEALYTANPLDSIPATSSSPVTGIGALARASAERSIRPSSRASRLSGGQADRLPPTAEGGPDGGLLREMVDAGIGRGREVWGAEPGRDVWRRLIG